MNEGGVSGGLRISQDHCDTALSYYAKAVEEGAAAATCGAVPDRLGERAGVALECYAESGHVCIDLLRLKRG